MIAVVRRTVFASSSKNLDKPPNPPNNWFHGTVKGMFICLNVFVSVHIAGD